MIKGISLKGNVLSGITDFDLEFALAWCPDLFVKAGTKEEMALAWAHDGTPTNERPFSKSEVGRRLKNNAFKQPKNVEGFDFFVIQLGKPPTLRKIAVCDSLEHLTGRQRDFEPVDSWFFELVEWILDVTR